MGAGVVLGIPSDRGRVLMMMSLAPASKGGLAATTGIPLNHSRTRYGCGKFPKAAGSRMNPMLLILSKAWRLVLIEDDLSECMGKTSPFRQKFEYITGSLLDSAKLMA